MEAATGKRILTSTVARACRARDNLGAMHTAIRQHHIAAREGVCERLRAPMISVEDDDGCASQGQATRNGARNATGANDGNT
jgi:hypothetical protein